MAGSIKHPAICLLGTVLLVNSYAGQATDISDKVVDRINNHHTFDPYDYSLENPIELQDEIKNQNDHPPPIKPLIIDIKKAIEPFDHPETTEGINPNLLRATGNRYSIVDIREAALRNNLSIQIAQFLPSIAQTEVREEEAKFDNIIFAYAQYAEKDLPSISGDNVSFKSDNPNLDKQELKLDILAQEKTETSLVAGIKVPLRTGGTVTLSSPLSRKLTDGNFDSTQYQSALEFSFSQPLLRNAGRRANEASIRIAELNQQDAQLNTRLQSIRIIAMVDKAYWALYQAWGELDVRRTQYEYATQNLAMVKRRVEEGLTAAVELNRSEIGVADRMEALIVAQTKLKLAQRQLQFFMNDIVDNNPDPLIPTTQPNLLKFDFDREKLLNDAMDNRIELLQQELKLAADARKIEYLENQTLPLFSLDYQYGALSNQLSSMGDIYQGVLNGQFSDWAIGLKFEMPVTNEARKARLDNAIQQRMQRLTTKSLQMLTVKKEIYDALDKTDQNWQRIIAARKQVLIAGLNYEAELKQFSEGLRTMTEVLETLTRLGEAQIKEIKAITDYQVTLVDTAYATGTLLGYSKVQFN